MKIGIVSDTHSHPLPQQMLDDFKEVDFIIHCGDLCSKDVLNQLEKVKEVKAVHGNMDIGELRSILPRREVIHCNKFTIGLCHGYGPPYSLLKTVKSEFKDMNVDAIVFGHSHQPINQVINGVLYFNPGSPNDVVFAPYRSYGILELNNEIVGKIIKVRQQNE